MGDIVCDNCGGSFLETTEQYSDDIESHGAMFRVKKAYESWTCFPFHAGMRRGDLVCPGCDIIIADSKTWIVPVVRNNGKHKGCKAKQPEQKTDQDKRVRGSVRSANHNEKPQDTKDQDNQDIVINVMVMHNNGSTAADISKLTGLKARSISAIISKNK